MVELRRAAREAAGGGDFTTLKQEIMARHGVTDSMLVAWVRRRAGDVEQMSAIWDTIDARLVENEEDPR
jgi:hypothetical protein